MLTGAVSRSGAPRWKGGSSLEWVLLAQGTSEVVLGVPSSAIGVRSSIIYEFISVLSSDKRFKCEFEA